jgi:hypothetical protein
MRVERCCGDGQLAGYVQDHGQVPAETEVVSRYLSGAADTRDLWVQGTWTIGPCLSWAVAGKVQI